MRRYQAVCRHCGLVSPWQGKREVCLGDMSRHLEQEHEIAGVPDAKDYELQEQRQCDYCLEEYLDHCTKCDRDFCRFHQGDIDGLCGGCI